MNMIMPYILIPRRFVMLPGGDAITRIGCFQGESDPLNDPLDIHCVMDRQVEDVFEMLIGDNDHIARIIWPLMGGDEGRDPFVMIDHIA